MDTVVVIMLKDMKTGFLEKEVGSLPVYEHEHLMVNIFAAQAESGLEFHMKVTTDRDVADWEFSAVYDYYDEAVYEGCLKQILEVEDCYNPTWEMIFDFSGDIIDAEDMIAKLLAIHAKELKEVYEAIQDKKGDYMI